MPPESMILMLIGAWLLVSVAALWGMLRISRRHHTHTAPHPQRAPVRATHVRHKPAHAGR